MEQGKIEFSIADVLKAAAEKHPDCEEAFRNISHLADTEELRDLIELTISAGIEYGFNNKHKFIAAVEGAEEGADDECKQCGGTIPYKIDSAFCSPECHKTFKEGKR